MAPKTSTESQDRPLASPSVCGVMVEYTTRKGDLRTKPCLKAKGHSGNHNYRQMSPKVDLTVLAGKLDIAEAAPTDELLENLTERERSAEQLRVDADVIASHNRWAKAGKPKGFNDAIKKGAASRYTVAPEHAAAIRTLLRRTESAPGIKGKIHVRIAPTRKHASGNVMVYFVGVDKTTHESTRAAANS